MSDTPKQKLNTHLNPKLKLKLVLKAREDIIDHKATNDLMTMYWKKGESLTLVNNVFDTNTGIAFWPIDRRWDIVLCEILEQ